MGIDYDVFRIGNLDNWEATLDDFYKSVRDMEQDAKRVLTSCVTNFRSTEQGLVFLRDLSTLDARRQLIKFFANKYEDIMQHFFDKLSATNVEFFVSVLGC